MRFGFVSDPAKLLLQALAARLNGLWHNAMLDAPRATQLYMLLIGGRGQGASQSRAVHPVFANDAASTRHPPNDTDGPCNLCTSCWRPRSSMSSAHTWGAHSLEAPQESQKRGPERRGGGSSGNGMRLGGNLCCGVRTRSRTAPRPDNSTRPLMCVWAVEPVWEGG